MSGARRRGDSPRRRPRLRRTRRSARRPSTVRSPVNGRSRPAAVPSSVPRSWPPSRSRRDQPPVGPASRAPDDRSRTVFLAAEPRTRGPRCPRRSAASHDGMREISGTATAVVAASREDALALLGAVDRIRSGIQTSCAASRSSRAPRRPAAHGPDEAPRFERAVHPRLQPHDRRRGRCSPDGEAVEGQVRGLRPGIRRRLAIAQGQGDSDRADLHANLDVSRFLPLGGVGLARRGLRRRGDRRPLLTASGDEHDLAVRVAPFELAEGVTDLLEWVGPRDRDLQPAFARTSSASPASRSAVAIEGFPRL